MAMHMEDRFPIIDILEQTPQIPDNCQWALFLRNHDELTLEMVTDEERDYMYRAYAHDSEMRINLGIRRRLAPLLGNDRRKIELMNGLLFSLPGTPVMYYGDEIGMGDNIYLGDRNGVRTPMQWSADRNAGFSRANPQRLILPVIIDPEYHYEAINVEAQQNNPNSLLWWMKRLIALRKQFQAFGRGTMEFLDAGELPRAGVRARARRRRDDPGGRQPVALPAVRRAGPGGVQGDAAAGAVRPHRIPGDRRPALPADAARLRVLLVFDRAAAGRCGRGRSRRLPATDAGVPQRRQPAGGRRTRRAGGRAFAVPGDAALVRRARVPRHRHAHRRRRGDGRRSCAGGACRIREPRGGALRVAAGHRAGDPGGGAARAGGATAHARRRRAAGRRDGGRRGSAGSAQRAGGAHARVERDRQHRRQAVRGAAAPGRGAAQHQRATRRGRGPLRRSLPAEDVPPAGGRHQPRAGASPLPQRARPRAGAHHRRRDRVPAPPRGDEHARRAAGVRPQRGHGLDARARGAAPFLRARAHPASRGRRCPPPRRARCTSWRPPSRRPPRATSSARTSIWRRCWASAPPRCTWRWRPTSTTPASRPEPYSTLDRRSKYQSVRNLVGKTVRLLRDNMRRLPAEIVDAGRRQPAVRTRR